MNNLSTKVRPHAGAGPALSRRGYADGAKRAFDLTLALVALPLVLPMILVLMVMIRAEGGPGLFAHRRVGQYGVVFRCWKLRTMVVGAEERLGAYLSANPAAAREWAETQKLTHDPRVTRLGGILRRTSLDELPQILNVIRGEMSFVGPRPITASELERYAGNRRFYLMCRPGITGLWQVLGRNCASYDDRVALDRRYAETIGFVTDLSLILRTVPAVLHLTGS